MDHGIGVGGRVSATVAGCRRAEQFNIYIDAAAAQAVVRVGASAIATLSQQRLAKIAHGRSGRRLDKRLPIVHHYGLSNPKEAPHAVQRTL